MLASIKRHLASDVYQSVQSAENRAKYYGTGVMIEEQVKAIVGSLLPEGTAVTSNESALVSLGINSLSMVNLLLEIEAAFNVTIPPKLVTPANFRSVNSLTQLVESLKLAA